MTKELLHCVYSDFLWYELRIEARPDCLIHSNKIDMVPFSVRKIWSDWTRILWEYAAKRTL